MNQHTPAATIALVARLTLASVLIAHGALLLVAYAIPAFGADLAAMGMPLAPAWPLCLVELFGGALLMFGLPRGRARRYGLPAPA